MQKIFITDAGYKHTLGAVRSLGKKGFYIIGGSQHKHSVSFYSKYCKESVIYPNPREEQKFIDFLIEYLKINKVDVLLPIGYLTTIAISKHKKILSKYTHIPVADYQYMQIAGDKARTMELARMLNVPTPIEYQSIDEIQSFPVVAKGIYESGQIQYINSQDELDNISSSDLIFQEYIPGEGVGFYALFNNGEVKAIFMHKRLREYPITGGASTAAVSIFDEELKDLGLKILKALNWHGVAMVEFKKDYRDGSFKLMEINPKFWGSLDLSIASGVDFPYLVVRMALEGDVDAVFDYKQEQKYMWPFPDDTFAMLANHGYIKNVLRDLFNADIKTNITFDDIKPNLFQILQTGIMVLYRIILRKTHFPHGKPEIKS